MSEFTQPPGVCSSAIEAKIALTLSMQAGFKGGAAERWSKILYAAIEPLIDGETPLNVPKPAHGEGLGAGQSDPSVRLEAVVAFSKFLLSKGDSESMPNSFALEEMVNSWNAAHNHNAALPEPALAAQGEAD
jgi:hypothetical protein